MEEVEQGALGEDRTPCTVHHQLWEGDELRAMNEVLGGVLDEEVKWLERAERQRAEEEAEEEAGWEERRWKEIYAEEQGVDVSEVGELEKEIPGRKVAGGQWGGPRRQVETTGNQGAAVEEREHHRALLLCQSNRIQV